MKRMRRDKCVQRMLTSDVSYFYLMDITSTEVDSV